VSIKEINNENTSMVSFLKKVMKFFIIFVLVNFLISSFVYSRKNTFVKVAAELYKQKYSYLEKNINKYDTVFLGSSRVLRGFNPRQFDKATGRKTFNLGFITFLHQNQLIHLNKA
jgi:hypothetical protein